LNSRSAIPIGGISAPEMPEFMTDDNRAGRPADHLVLRQPVQRIVGKALREARVDVGPRRQVRELIVAVAEIRDRIGRRRETGLDRRQEARVRVTGLIGDNAVPRRLLRQVHLGVIGIRRPVDLGRVRVLDLGEITIGRSVIVLSDEARRIGHHVDAASRFA